MFKDKVAIVTGAGGGIGQKVAIRLAEEGAKVVVVNRTESKGLETLQKIKELGGEGIFVQAESTSPEDVRNYVKQTFATYGRIDMLFNNAGMAGDRVPLVQYEDDSFSQIVDVNVKGTFLGMKYVIGAMLQSSTEGVILNTASVLGVTGCGYMSAYSATKHAIIGLTKSAAVEYAGKGIRVNALCPGFVETPMAEEVDAANQIASRVPMNRFATTDEVADYALFLLSDKSKYITGTVQIIDGGINSSSI